MSHSCERRWVSSIQARAVLKDRLHHAFEHGIENHAGFLGVAVGEQLHRALEVGKQHGDLLAFAFERGLGGEDLLGEVLGGITRWRSELLRRRGGHADGMRALGTEFRGGRDERAAVRTGPLEGRGAFLAELSTSAVIVVAAGALHDGAVRLCRK